MKKTGRHSGNGLSLVSRRELPRAAEGGKEIWREVVGAFRSDWFQGCEAILSAYCSTVTTERQLAGWITEHGVEDERWAAASAFLTRSRNSSSSRYCTSSGSR